MNFGNRVTVTRPEEDGLRQQVWDFTLFDLPAIYLENYVLEERETKRHKFRPVQVYNRLSGGRACFATVIKEEPGVPEDVLEEVIAKVQKMIEFRVWKDRRKG
jgi:hypothetical protein